MPTVAPNTESCQPKDCRDVREIRKLACESMDNGVVWLTIGETARAMEAFRESRGILERIHIDALDGLEKESIQHLIREVEWTIGYAEGGKALFLPPGTPVRPLPNYIRDAISELGWRVLDGRRWEEEIATFGVERYGRSDFVVGDWNVFYYITTGRWTTAIKATYKEEDGTIRERRKDDPCVAVQVPNSYWQEAKRIPTQTEVPNWSWSEKRIPALKRKVALERKFFRFVCRTILKPYIIGTRP